jgi:glycosyltransferase involved in cell wall biosynthesis
MLVSICVCTYNRAELLSRCLDSLTKLTVPTGYDAEIVVVDNNSSDNTKAVVHHFAALSPIRISYFFEIEQGVSAARNRAIREVRGEYVGFFDDECAVMPDWLQEVIEDILEFAPRIIGGPYFGAVLPGAFSKWFKTEYGNAYFIAKNYPRGFQKDFSASANNMVLHRQVFDVVRFDPNFGPKGDEMKFGSEAFVQQEFLRKNLNVSVFYDPRMKVLHYILPDRMSLRYYAKRQLEMGACHYHPTIYAFTTRLGKIMRHLCLFPFRTIFRDREVYPYLQNYVYEKTIPLIMPVIGAGLEKIRRRYQPPIITSQLPFRG